MKFFAGRTLGLALGIAALHAAALDAATSQEIARTPAARETQIKPKPRTHEVRETQTKQKPGRAPERKTMKEQLNGWTVGLAGGLLEGAPIRFATEIARVADDGDNLHVLPIVTRGPTENMSDLLYLRGVDAAIINVDVLEHFKSLVPN